MTRSAPSVGEPKLVPLRHRRGSSASVVLLHGFTQSGVSWQPVIEALDDHAGLDAEVITVDLPGHGTAPPGLDHMDLAQTATHLAELIGQAIWVGYSMGGRVALRVGLDHPQVVSSSMLIGATAGIDDPTERADRRRADEDLADLIEEDGVPAFLDRWLQGPMFAGLDVPAADLEARRANRSAGLAASLRNAGTGTMDPPWWDELGRISSPTAVVAGELDPKFGALADRLVHGVGQAARRITIAGAGHAAHIEQPGVVASLIADHIRRTD